MKSVVSEMQINNANNSQSLTESFEEVNLKTRG